MFIKFIMKYIHVTAVSVFSETAFALNFTHELSGPTKGRFRNLALRLQKGINDFIIFVSTSKEHCFEYTYQHLSARNIVKIKCHTLKTSIQNVTCNFLDISNIFLAATHLQRKKH